MDNTSFQRANPQNPKNRYHTWTWVIKAQRNKRITRILGTNLSKNEQKKIQAEKHNFHKFVAADPAVKENHDCNPEQEKK